MIRITKTENGMVRGIEAADPRITAFKGIPFAAPPVGENRWRAPRPAENWDGIRDCARFAPISMQPIPGIGDNIYTREWHVDPEIPMSEDCLYLNIWTPAKTAEEKLPVLVWFFGGGLQCGYTAEMEFDGERIARRGIVVVSVNYRVGPFGYLAHPQITAEQPEAPANFGSLDQREGLLWVQRNISAFGGNPENVTIAGQSAGGGSVMSQLAYKENEGLFSKAVVMSAMIRSPYADTAVGTPAPLWKAEERGQNFFDFMGVNDLEEARSLSAETVRDKYEQYVKEAPIMTTVQDGIFCLDDPIRMYLEGNCVDVEMMAGNTRDEFPGLIQADCAEGLELEAEKIFGDKKETFLGFEEGHVYTEGRGYAKVNGIELTVRRIFEEKSRQNKKGYYYCFDADIPGWDNPGTFHSVDLWFWFETLAKCWRPLTGRHYDLARQMCNYFSNFIKTGDPNGEDADGTAMPVWMPYSEEAPCAMVFDRDGSHVSYEKPGEYKRFLMQHIQDRLVKAPGMDPAFMRPVWEGGEVFRETFAMIEKDGVTKAPFLYTPKQILKVKSYDSGRIYREGKDYLVEDGFLILPEGSSIPAACEEQFYFNSQEEAKEDQKNYPFDFGPLETTDGRYLYLGAIGHPERITAYDVCVTYTTDEKLDGQKFTEEPALPGLKAKIEAGEEVNVLLFGDSISCGWDCSSKYRQAPNQPGWYDMVFAEAKEKWQVPIKIHNTSLGGVNSDWAYAQVENRVLRYSPDLVILAFGMNDRCEKEVFKEKTERIITKIRETLPNCEFVLVITTLPNEKVDTAPYHFWAYQDTYGEVLMELAEEHRGIVCADAAGLQRLVQEKKRYMDVTGNLLNHPNDYLVRLQAQVVAGALGLL